MRLRKFGRLGWQVSEVGYGMWGLAGWTGSDRDTYTEALQRAVDLGCNFFDTAWAYGEGLSERVLGDLLKANPTKHLYVATKVPPKDRRWPSRRTSLLADVFPPGHVREYCEKSLKGLDVACIDLLQFHVWEDAWAHDDDWQDTLRALKGDGLVRGLGVSVNRWEPNNVLETLRTGLVDAVQVIYNIFDQAPEDELLPLCEEMDVAVIARVPFDEGTLTGTLALDSSWPEGDWRNTYFVPENLTASVARAEALRPLVPPDMTMAELALRWVLAESRVATVIPGMRRARHVEENMKVSDGRSLDPALLGALKAHRWDRVPTPWSQ